MDGRDRGTIKIDACHLDAAQRGRGIAGKTRVEPRFQRIGLRRRGLRAVQAALGFHQAPAQALAQLLRSRFSERRHQNLLNAQVPFEQQAQINKTDIVGLAGAGAGLDQHAAMQRHVLPLEGWQTVRRRDHGCFTACAVACGARCST